MAKDSSMGISPDRARAISEFLEKPENAGLSHSEAARSLGLNEAAIRRARAKLKGSQSVIKLDEIREEIQFRVAIDDQTVAEYADAYREGKVIPRPVVYRDAAGATWLADGIHRVRAAKLAELDALEFEVKAGSKRDAYLYAAAANERHGLRRNAADRRKAIEWALDDSELSTLSNRELGRTLDVDEKLIRLAKIAREKAANPDPATTPDAPTRPLPGQIDLPFDVARVEPESDLDGDFDDGEIGPDPITLPAPLARERKAEVAESGGGAVDSPADEPAEDPAAAKDSADDDFLKGLPLTGRLTGEAAERFAEDALVYRDFVRSPAWLGFKNLVEASFPPVKGKARVGGMTRAAVEAFKARLVHPRDWKLCGGCQGEGCAACGGRGYGDR